MSFIMSWPQWNAARAIAATIWGCGGLVSNFNGIKPTTKRALSIVSAALSVSVLRHSSCCFAYSATTEDCYRRSPSQNKNVPAHDPFVRIILATGLGRHPIHDPLCSWPAKVYKVSWRALRLYSDSHSSFKLAVIQK